MRKTSRTIMGVALAAGATVALTVGAGPVQAAPDGGKGAAPLPAVGEYDRVNAPMPTGAVAAQAAAADRAHLATFARIQAGWTARAQGRAVPADVSAAAAPTAKTLAVPYTEQTTSYWCGPATLSNVLTYLRLGWSGSASSQQQAAANLLNTTTDGTNWYGSDNVPSYPGTSWYPVQDALNYKLYQAGRSFRYAVHALPGSPTSAQQAAYKATLVSDVGTSSMPIAANEYAAPGYQIGKQPSGEWIMHWIAPNGYASSGATTVFSDPGWGNGSASTDTSTRVVVALGGRGYMG